MSETNDLTTPTVTHSHARFAQYFEISESTVKRGLNDLRARSLLGERWEKLPAARSPQGYRQVGHYWLQSPFGTKSREKARELDTAEREGRAITTYPSRQSWLASTTLTSTDHGGGLAGGASCYGQKAPPHENPGPRGPRPRSW